MHPFTIAFLIALATTTLIRLWLGRRHVAHVLAHRDAVPAEFAETVTLAAHQKAADYTAAKTRLAGLETLVSAAVLLAFTLGGGLQALADGWGRALAPGGYWHGIALIASVAVIGGLIDLPFAVYRTFVVEARFGFNRMTPLLFVADLARHAALAAALGLPLVFVVLWLMDRMGELWWLYVWLAWMGFNLLVLAIYPTVIAPLFNRFTPLEDPRSRAASRRCSRAAGSAPRGCS